MSASLVGSEMCIRDRSMTVLLARRSSRRACSRACSTVCAAAPPLATLKTCLLYTSDAADDM
eukprot:154751-Alexandrium_andersonii.AAC.1